MQHVVCSAHISKRIKRTDSNTMMRYNSWTYRPDGTPCVNSLYTTGEDLVQYEFPDKDTTMEWEKLVVGIKAHAAEGVAKSSTYNWTNNKVASNMYDWFALVKDLESKFGSEMVPPDILRSAKNNNDLLAEWKYKTIQIGVAEGPSREGCKLVKILKKPEY